MLQFTNQTLNTSDKIKLKLNFDTWMKVGKITKITLKENRLKLNILVISEQHFKIEMFLKTFEAISVPKLNPNFHFTQAISNSAN